MTRKKSVRKEARCERNARRIGRGKVKPIRRGSDWGFAGLMQRGWRGAHERLRGWSWNEPNLTCKYRYSQPLFAAVNRPVSRKQNPAPRTGSGFQNCALFTVVNWPVSQNRNQIWSPEPDLVFGIAIWARTENSPFGSILYLFGHVWYVWNPELGYSL